MKLEHLPLWKRIAVGYATVAALVVGLWVRESCRHLCSRPFSCSGDRSAWQTANGIMDGSIQIQSQMIAAGNVLNGIDVSQNERQLSESQKAPKTRLSGLGLPVPFRTKVSKR